jgi:hypothetical protein
MQPSPTTPIRSLIPAAILLALLGWSGLVLLIIFTQPVTWQPLWVFFFLSVMAISGTLMPAVAFLNRRFPSHPPASGGVVVRQSLWFGLYFSVLAWLQIGRVLNTLLMILLAVGLIVIEIMLRMREISQKPE